MNSVDSFATLLRDSRKDRKLTQYELAERARCSESAIRKFENGQRRPSQQVSELLAAALSLEGSKRMRFLRAASGAPLEASDESLLPPTNLPAQLTSLIGRETAIANLAALLRQDEARLVTVVGPPGIGKTRLALATAAQLRTEFEDGVFVVALAALREPGAVLPTIAAALGLRDNGREPLALTLKDYLRRRRMLLLLDNFEQVIAAATTLTDQLGWCPHLKLLVTSRELLRVRGERHLELPPLDLPSDELSQTPAAVSRYAAARLFVERAREAAPLFALSSENAAAVGRICRLVDGLPLAIELVAARVRLLPPAALLKQLEGSGSNRAGSLKVLSGGARDLPERHRTLRDAIRWSYDLLDGDERLLFIRLGVFSGGWTLASAEAVCNAHGDLTTPLLDVMTSLRNKNLIHAAAGPQDEPRLAMLATISEYAAESLAATGAVDEIRRRHAEYFLALAQATEPQLRGPDQQVWLSRLADDHANLWSTLDWLLARGEVETAARLAAALTRFWLVHGHLNEGRDWFNRLLTERARLSGVALARALAGAGLLARSQGDYDAARVLLQESLALARERDLRPTVAAALKDLGTVYDYQGDLATAATLYQQSLETYRELGDSWGEAACLNNMGTLLAIGGQRGEALRLYQQALAIRRSIGDKSGVAASLNNLAFTHYNDENHAAAEPLWRESLRFNEELGDKSAQALILTNLGELARRLGNLAQARELLERGLALRRALGDKRGTATTLFYLGSIAHQAGDYQRARDLLRQCLTLLGDMAAKLSLIDALAGFAGLAAAVGASAQAVHLYSAAQAAREAAGAPLAPADMVEQERNLDITRAQLAGPDWATAWRTGAAMTLDEAVEYALRLEL